MEMKDDGKTRESMDTGHGYMRVVPAIAAAAVLGLAVLAAAVKLMLQRVPHLLRPDDVPPAVPTLPSLDGGLTLVPLLLAGILLVLVGVFVLLLLLVLCMCVCKCGGASGIPIPGLPDLRGIAAILRGIATVLKEGATKIDTANGVVNQAREKLTAVTSFKVKVPKFKSVGHIDILGFSGEAYAPDGFENWSPFDAATEEKLTKLANDVTGKATLDGASAMLREKAGILETQAHALDGQP